MEIKGPSFALRIRVNARSGHRKRAPHGTFEIASTQNGRRLGLSKSGELRLKPPDAALPFFFERAKGCYRYPEAQADATGKSFKGTTANGTVKGFVDAHLHITADMRAGGRVIDGQAFDRVRDHARRSAATPTTTAPTAASTSPATCFEPALPFGTHDTHGWPTFAGWPVHDTNTHQQTYYVWLERAWMAGERLVVAQTVEDAAALQDRAAPLALLQRDRRRSSSRSSELEGSSATSTRRAAGRARAGSGSSASPRQAKQVIEQGKLAVVIGIESSDLFDCSEFMDEPNCTKARRRPRHRAATSGSASAACSSPTGSTTRSPARRSRAARKGSFINDLQGASDRRATSRTGPCPEKGQGEEVSTLGLLDPAVPVAVLPGREAGAGRPDPGLPGREAVQRQGPDRPRRLPGPPA